MSNTTTGNQDSDQPTHDDQNCCCQSEVERQDALERDRDHLEKCADEDKGEDF